VKLSYTVGLESLSIYGLGPKNAYVCKLFWAGVVTSPVLIPVNYNVIL
jgi:hypothetical protein